MNRFAFLVLAVLLAGGATAARAQSTSQPTSPSKTKTEASPRKTTTVDPRDSVTIADVRRAADSLAIAVQAVVKKVTESPELKVAALKLATNAVNAAQVIVAQQAATLQATLEALAREVAIVTEKQSKSKTR